MNNLLTYKGGAIHYEGTANGNLKVNVTEFAKAFPDKNLSQIVNSQEIKEYVETLSKLQNYSFVDLLEVRKGSPELGGGTWAHEMVALRVAQKLSTEFAIMVDTKIRELMHGHHQNTTFADVHTISIDGQQWYNYKDVLRLLGLSVVSGAVSGRVRKYRIEFRKIDGVWFVSNALATMMLANVQLQKQREASRQRQLSIFEAWNKRQLVFNF